MLTSRTMEAMAGVLAGAASSAVPHTCVMGNYVYTQHGIIVLVLLVLVLPQCSLHRYGNFRCCRHLRCLALPYPYPVRGWRGPCLNFKTVVYYMKRELVFTESIPLQPIRREHPCLSALSLPLPVSVTLSSSVLCHLALAPPF